MRAGGLGKPVIPVAVALGGDPATIWSGSAPLPPVVDEILFAGWLRKASVEMVKCVTNDLEVPADSELVIEGWVDPAELRWGGTILGRGPQELPVAVG